MAGIGILSTTTQSSKEYKVTLQLTTEEMRQIQHALNRDHLVNAPAAAFLDEFLRDVMSGCEANWHADNHHAFTKETK